MPRFPAQIDFPERVWELSPNGGWTSRPAVREDYIRRGEIIHALKAVSNSLHIPVEENKS
jgi:hypothetical protein